MELVIITINFSTIIQWNYAVFNDAVVIKIPLILVVVVLQCTNPESNRCSAIELLIVTHLELKTHLQQTFVMSV